LARYTEDFDPNIHHLPLKKLPDSKYLGFYPKWKGPLSDIPPVSEGQDPTYTEDGYLIDYWKTRAIDFVDNRAVTTAIFKGGWDIVDKQKKGSTAVEKQFCIRVEMPGVSNIKSIKIQRFPRLCQIIISAPRVPLEWGQDVLASYTINFGPRNRFAMDVTADELRDSGTLQHGIYTLYVEKQGIDGASC